MRAIRYVVHLVDTDPVEMFVGGSAHWPTVEAAREILGQLDGAFDWKISEVQIWLTNSNIDAGFSMEP